MGSLQCCRGVYTGVPQARLPGWLACISACLLVVSPRCLVSSPDCIACIACRKPLPQGQQEKKYGRDIDAHDPTAGMIQPGTCRNGNQQSSVRHAGQVPGPTPALGIREVHVRVACRFGQGFRAELALTLVLSLERRTVQCLGHVTWLSGVTRYEVACGLSRGAQKRAECQWCGVRLHNPANSSLPTPATCKF